MINFFKTKEERRKIELEKVLSKLIKIYKFISRDKFGLSPSQFKELLWGEIVKDRCLRNFFEKTSKEDTSKIINCSRRLWSIDQIEEGLNTGALLLYSKAELKELGISEEEISIIDKNNKKEIQRLSKFSEKELLDMGIPVKDIKLLKKNKNPLL